MALSTGVMDVELVSDISYILCEMFCDTCGVLLAM